VSFDRGRACAWLAGLLLSCACTNAPSDVVKSWGDAAGRTAGGSGGSAGSGGATGGADTGGGGLPPAAGSSGKAAAGRAGAGAVGTGGVTATAGAAGRSGSGGTAGTSNAVAGGGSGGREDSVGMAGTESGEGGDADSGEPADRPGWELVWSDEFEGASGTPVDSESWNLVNRGDGFGNNELQYYTNRTENAVLDGEGSLVITANEEEHGERSYTSARLESIGKVELTYGRVEGRLKIPFGQGIWPAFWMLGADIGSVGWPGCGEIDIMENVGHEPTVVHGTLHGPGYSGGNPLGASYSLPGNPRFADDFHVFAVEWEEDVVRWYVDDELYKTRTPADVPDGARWVYDHPFYVILNVAVGGNWPGAPDSTTTFPQTMLVDYVRIYGRP
jgi:beta-glucanase (GH16 family)